MRAYDRPENNEELSREIEGFYKDQQLPPEIPANEPKEYISSLDTNKPLELSDKLRVSLAETSQTPVTESIEKYNHLSNSEERLRHLLSLPVSEALACVDASDVTRGGLHYLHRRLDFYEKLVDGTATKFANGQEYPIDSGSVSAETLKLGLYRDICYAVMQGTPEMGATKIATEWVNQKRMGETEKSTGEPKKPIRNVVQFWGYYSGVNVYEDWGTHNLKTHIGMYQNVIKLYKQCQEEVTKDATGETLEEQTLEHRSVLLMAERLRDAFYYAGSALDRCASPYSAHLDEAVKVGRLGEPARRQFAGMRHKIQETNLTNVERFVGKSGESRTSKEAKKLHWELEHYPNATEEEKEAWVTEANRQDTAKENGWYRWRLEVTRNKADRRFGNVHASELPTDEHELQMATIAQDYRKQMVELEEIHKAKIEKLQNRTPEELLEERRLRQQEVAARINKDKSLAEKAIDLHFRFVKQEHLDGVIDWINQAPFGTIKRSMAALEKGVSEEDVLAMAMTEILTKGGGYTRKEFDKVKVLLPRKADRNEDSDEVEKENNERKRVLTDMMTLSKKMQEKGLEPLTDIDAIIQITKNESGIDLMVETLGAGFSLEEIKRFPYLVSPLVREMGK